MTQSPFSVASDRWRSWRDRRWLANPDAGAGPAQVFTAPQRVILLAIFTMVVVLRLPQAWLHGRFFAEEGTIFLAYAWHRPVGEALWRSFAGYLNLGANASTVLVVELVKANALSLERAPYLTMGIATAFQMLPAIFILTGRSPWLSSRWAVVASLLIVATAPMTEEVFANVLHIQFHLALCAALVLALDVPRSRSGRVFHWLPLVLAPLCGPGAIILLPLFVLRAMVDKNPGRAIQAAILGASSALQLLVFYMPSPLRGDLLDPASLANILFVRLAVLPYLGAPFANHYGGAVHAAMVAGGADWWAMTALALAYFTALLGLALRGGGSGAVWLILPGLVIGSVSFGAGMLRVDPYYWFSVGAAQRYSFLPLTLLGMGLVALIRSSDGLLRAGLIGLFVLTLASGALTFAFPIRDIRTGPDWHLEVAAWRKDQRHLLMGWPARWPIDLSPHKFPCASPEAARTNIPEPTYCESRWAAFVRAGGGIRAWQLPPPAAR